MGVMRRICKECKWAVQLAWNRKYVWCRVFKTWMKKMAQACKKFEPKTEELPSPPPLR